jgi:hypothetical protein
MSDTDQLLMDRREAVKRVTALLGGIALVGSGALLTGCGDDGTSRSDTTAARFADFTADEIAFLDEVADTILPETSTPGAKAAKVGAFMALMVKDGYDARDQRIFRDGMRAIDDASQKTNGTRFMQATPAQRLALLQTLDREQKSHMDARETARKAASGRPESPETKKADAYLPDQRKEGAAGADVSAAPAITADSPAHYFRMMKELALLGYFTSEIGVTQAQRYQESPGRFDPCIEYKPGETSFAAHA